MEIPIPAWFKYRQGKAESAGDNCYKLSAPVSDPAFIRIRQINGNWQAAVAGTADGADLQATQATIDKAHDAWLAAFELYRTVRIY